MEGIHIAVDEVAEKYNLRETDMECCGSCTHFTQDSDGAPCKGVCLNPLMQGRDDLHGGPLVYPKPTDICDLYESVYGVVVCKVLALTREELAVIKDWLENGHPDYRNCGRVGVITTWTVEFDDGFSAELRINHDDLGDVWADMVWYYNGNYVSQGCCAPNDDKIVEGVWEECDDSRVRHNVCVTVENDADAEDN